MSKLSEFKKMNSFEVRYSESMRILNKYPNYVPIICEQAYHRNDLPNIDKQKYLVPSDFTLAQFMLIIRQRLKLNADEGLFLLIKDTFVSASILMSHLYSLYKDEDGFMYIQYCKENTFGFSSRV